jgi:glycosyltransferase involved in cell wall biosynthesis
MSLRLISVVVPVYNEHDNIATCLRGLWRALQGVEHEILVVYDFDADTTLGAIRAMNDAPATLRLVKNDIGKGAANAIRAGFAAARGDVVVTTMADLSDPPEKILELADVMRASGAAVVAGSRYMAGGTQEGGPLIKRTLSRIAGVTLRWIGGIGTHDATNNFKAYSKEFLDSIQVEAQGAFDIGLELTVKAHLAGRGVEEVPTSWRDRSAGESRFKVWAWAPKYLRWYWMAMGAPIAVLAVWLAAWSIEARMSRWTDGIVGIEPALSTAFALVGLGALWFARRFRGRILALDGLIALAWCNPFHSQLHHAGWTWAGPSLAAAITIALYIATFRHGAWQRVGTWLRKLTSLRNALFVALTLVVWPYLIYWPHFDHTTNLDPSWQRAFDFFLAAETRSGAESVFTYGPLGGLHTVIWVPNAFWARVVLVEGLLKLCGAGFFVAVAFSMRGWLERCVWLLALPVARLSSDTAMMVILASAGATLLARRRMFGPALFIACAMFIETGFTKFTFQMLSLVCVGLLTLELASRKQYLRALGPIAIYAALYLVLWLGANQNLLDLPTYWRGSLEIVSGYGKSQANPELNRSFGAVPVVALCVAVACLARAFASRWSVRSLAICALTGAVLTLGFKAAVMSTPMSLVFTEVAMVLPLLALAGTKADENPRAVPLWIARAAAFGAIVLAAPGSRWMGLVDSFGWPKAAAIARDDVVDKLSLFGKAHSYRETLRKGDEAAVKRYDMPRVRAEIGDEPVDVLGVSQALAVFNGFNYRCRPILQAYSVHTSYLMRRNVEYFRGETARVMC